MRCVQSHLVFSPGSELKRQDYSRYFGLLPSHSWQNLRKPRALRICALEAMPFICSSNDNALKLAS